MAARAQRVAAAAIVVIASLVAAGWSIALQVDTTRLLAQTRAARIAPLPAELLSLMPAEARAFSQQPALTADQRRRVADALWRAPFDPTVFNLHYTDAIRTGRPEAETSRLAETLADLSWRHTSAQVNLLMRSLLGGEFNDVLDRVDSFLRRQTQAPLSFAMLSTMEGVPQVHDEIVDKLRLAPDWRRNYLSVIDAQSPPALLDARIDTLATLLDTPRGLSRAEIAPSLVALLASGREDAAYELWTRWTGQTGGTNLVHDADFREAAALMARPDLAIPFDWALNQGLGYSAFAHDGGVSISWDRRGVPLFLAQTVPVRPGRAELTIQGTSSQGALGELLVPTLSCEGRSFRFEPVGPASGATTRFRSEALPGGCNVATLAINGAVDAGAGPVTIDLARIELASIDGSGGETRANRRD